MKRLILMVGCLFIGCSEEEAEVLGSCVLSCSGCGGGDNGEAGFDAQGNMAGSYTTVRYDFFDRYFVFI